MQRIIGVVLVTGFAASLALATDYTWLGGAGLFSDSAKWSPEGVPTDGDTAKLSSTADGTVTFTGPVNNNQMIVTALNGNTLTLDLAGNTYTLTNRFYFESAQNSSFLTVSNGTLLATNICDVKISQGVAPARLTFADGAVASLYSLYTYRSDVNVQTGASLTCDGEVKIGDGTANSESALTVNGGELTLNNHLWMNGGNNSTSTLTITDGNVISKKYFSIGNGGSGTGWGVLNLSGGTLETQADVWLGNAGTTRAVANISGGLWVPKSNFEVAHGGYTVSWLNMSGGEIYMPTSSKNMLVANSGNGHFTTGTVSVVGGTITVTNNASISVGNSSNGLGRVYLGGTGTIYARDFKLGTYKTARGECSVTGGLLQADNYIGIGATSEGDGFMLVDGGDIRTPQIKVGDSAGSTGSFMLTNGTVVTSSKFTVGATGTGTCYIAGGSLVMSNDFALGAGSPGNGSVIMTGGDVKTTTNLKVGDWGGVGSFELRDGTITCLSSAIVGNGNGSSGILTMTGGRLLSVQNMTLANNGLNGAWGTLYMGGGELICSNTLMLANGMTNWGNAVITGGNTEANYLAIGGSGEGHWVQSNGTVTARQNLTIGSGATSTGSVTMAGGELTVRSTCIVGSYGYGSLYVSGGELAITNAVNVADATNSLGFLTLAGGFVSTKGGTWGNRGVAQVEIIGGTNTFFGSVSVGVYTQGVLNISGGSNTFVGLYVAKNNAGSSATMTVSGGQTYNNSYLDIGQAGPATLEVSGGELTTSYLRMNPGTPVDPVPPQSEIRVTGGRLQVNNDCYMPDTASITGKLTLAGGVFAAPAVRQHHGKLHVLFDGGTVEAIKSDSTFIRALDWLALTGNGLVVDSAGFAIGTSLVLPDADGEQGRLAKKGVGTFTLYAVNTFTGPVVVQEGELALGSSGLITLAGGCEIDGGALLNLSARTLDFTLPAGTVSCIDGELRLAVGETLTVASGATLGGTGTVGRVVFEAGATLSRSTAHGAALLNATECVLPAGAVISLTGYSEADLLQGVTVVSAGTLNLAPAASVKVLLDGVPQSPVALRVSGGTLTVSSYNPATLIRVQ